MDPEQSHKLKRISLGRKKSAAYKTNSIQNCKTHIRTDYVIQIGDRNKQAKKINKEEYYNPMSRCQCPKCLTSI